jgi:phosphoribosylglycinamide formyltransferase-1
MKIPPNIAFFASGAGTTMEAFLEEWKAETLAVVPKILITNNSNCGAVEIARRYGVEVFHISLKTHPNEEEFAKELLLKLQNHDVDLLLLVGYMKKLPANIIAKYPHRIFNTHPALLPKYGGKGMFGLNVHTAVIENNETESGATIHYVTDEYDEGQIIAQSVVCVEPNDTPESLQEKVKKSERMLYIDTIRAFILQDQYK